MFCQKEYLSNPETETETGDGQVKWTPVKRQHGLSSSLSPLAIRMSEPVTLSHFACRDKTLS